MDTNDAVARVKEMINLVGTLTDGLAQYNAAQTTFYIASLHDVGLLSEQQVLDLNLLTEKALRDWEVHHASLNVDG